MTGGNSTGGNDVFNGKNRLFWYLVTQEMTTGAGGHGRSLINWAWCVNWSPGDSCHRIQNGSVFGNGAYRYQNSVPHVFVSGHNHDGDWPYVNTIAQGGFANDSYWIDHDANGNAFVDITSQHVGSSGPVSSTVMTTQLPQIPQTPANASGCTVARVSDTQHTISWTNNSTGTAPYANTKVYRKTDGGGWALIATLGVVTSYNDTSTTENHRYHYGVNVVGVNGVEVGTAEASDIWTTPGVPTSLAAAKIAGGNVRLTWTNNVNYGEYGVRIEESQNGGAYTEIASVATGVATWDHVAPNAANTHRYRVRSRTTSGTVLNSAYSVESATIVLLNTAGPPSNLAPTGIAKDGAEAIVFTWTHNPNDGTPQTKYQLQYKVGAGAFVTVGPTTSTASTYTMPASTLANGNTITWHVATASENGTIGAYSADFSFTTSARPTSNVSSPSGDGLPLNQNPYFETNVLNWFAKGGAGVTIARSTAQFHQGVASMLLTPNGTSVTAEYESDSVACIPGQALTASVWVRCSVARNFSLNLNYFSGGPATSPTGYLGSTSGAVVALVANTWTLVQTPGNALPGTNSASLAAYIDGTPAASVSLWTDEAILSSTSGTYNLSKLTAAWTYFQAQSSAQSSWHAYLYQKGALNNFSDATLVDEQAGVGTTSSATFAATLLNGQTYALRVYVTSAAGLTSIDAGTELQQFSVAFLPPALATIAAVYEPSFGRMAVTVTGSTSVPGVTEPISTIDLQRQINGGVWVTWATGIVVVGEPPVAIVSDTSPTINGTNNYRAISRSAVPSSRVSAEIAVATAEAQWGFLSTGPSFSQLVRMRARLTSRPSIGRDRTVYQFAGRTSPVELSGEGTQFILPIQATLYPPSRGGQSSEPGALEALALTTGVVLWRDYTGRRIFASLGDVSIDYNNDSVLYPVGFNLTKVDYDEDIG